MEQTIESVALQPAIVFDAMKYGGVKGLMKKVIPGGLKTYKMSWSLNKSFHKRFTFTFQPKNTKFINPYTFLGLSISMPEDAAINSLNPIIHQLNSVSDMDADNTKLTFVVRVTYFERNPDFHMAKV